MRARMPTAACLLLAGLAGCVSPDPPDEAVARNCPDTGTTTGTTGAGQGPGEVPQESL